MTATGLLDEAAVGAVVPEQVPAYVCAVAGSTPRMIGACVGYEAAGHLVLVGYPLHDPRDQHAMVAAVDDALKLPGSARITVIGPARPAQAPAAGPDRKDHYLSLPVPPPPPRQKLRNLLRRSGRDLTVECGRQCTPEHMALVQRYLRERELAAGTRHTAMYMFCFRSHELAPPGSADLLLAELLTQARQRGQTRMNLGLAVNA